MCTNTPTHFLVNPEYTTRDGNDEKLEVGPQAETYCARHYVLTLAELIELHLPVCTGNAADHVADYGSL